MSDKEIIRKEWKLKACNQMIAAILDIEYAYNGLPCASLGGVFPDIYELREKEMCKINRRSK